MIRERALTILAFAGALLLLHAILVMPSHPAGLSLARMIRPTWELPAIVLALALARGPWMRGLVVALALALVVLRAADLGSFLAFSRPFNPLLDLHLMVSGWALLSGSVGRGEALAMIAAVLVVLGALGLLLWLCLARVARTAFPWRGGVAALPLAVALVAMTVPGWFPLAVTPAVASQIARMSDGVADLAVFTAALDRAPERSPGFAALEGRDVILAFVESYGRSFVEDAEYAAVSRPRLAAVEARLAEAGWSARSAWLAAPTRGGQSWLSHATLLSGLWVDGQIRYDRLMVSFHPSLNRLFREAGWRTGAAMPAITLDWPEGAWYGYDVTLDAKGLDYRGQPFEWVTMPDQYTWTAMDRKLRGGAPAMIELALITSHAPWTPLPEIVPWEAVGDGAIFDGTRRKGGTPREVWSNPETIRSQYALALDYALEVMGQYIAREGRGALFVVLGDHQPAPLLTGQDASPDVPIHVISHDPRLLDRLPETLFGPGLVPGPDAPTLPMQDFRAILTTIYETPLASR
ncbi:sulfatase [Jannaschia formosa]|uniref:sulfatase n=1 Tax=Jannaschia formosa TaxID=2259592 RepID=UPI000E1BA7E3|nr:sulfatase [Jannaschia formosa]TFL18375.1 sulfatase [Jannaschia formosa]